MTRSPEWRKNIVQMKNERKVRKLRTGVEEIVKLCKCNTQLTVSKKKYKF